MQNHLALSRVPRGQVCQIWDNRHGSKAKHQQPGFSAGALKLQSPWRVAITIVAATQACLSLSSQRRALRWHPTDGTIYVLIYTWGWRAKPDRVGRCIPAS